MAHLVFVETTPLAIRAIEHAIRLGHTATLLQSEKFSFLLQTEDRDKLRAVPCQIVNIADTQDAASVEAGLKTCLQAGPVDAVLSVLQESLAPAAIAAETLGLRASAARGVQNARDKGRCRDLLAANFIPSVRHTVTADAAHAKIFAAETGYPVIVKPTTGSGKLLTAIIHDQHAMTQHFASANSRRAALEAGLQQELTGEFIIEELAIGPLYSVELACDINGDFAALVILKRKTGRHNAVLEMGSTVPSDLNDAEYEEVRAYVIRVAKALGLEFGIFHIEFIMTSAGPRLVEVNPRVAGGAIPDLVRTATGVDLYEILVRLYAGEPIGTARLPSVAVASHTYICAQEDSTVREDLAPDWFETYRPRLHSGHSTIQPGQELRRMDGNFDYYGVVRVTARTPQQAIQDCENLRLEIAQTLGVRLVEVSD